MNNISSWIIFNAFVLLMLAIDLGVFHRQSKKVTFKEAITWSVVWITLALIFSGWIYYSMGQKPAVEFLTGYLVEKSLSVDNIFVFVLLFAFFKVPGEYQHRVLFWGVIGALVMRAIFIAVGAVLITKFHWIIYLFGIFLVYTGYMMFRKSAADMHPENNPLVRWFIKKGKVTNEYHGKKFFIVRNGKKLATPLFLCLLSIEFTDLIFAVDSIPAIFAITNDPFIVYTSNVFAILGLRSLYFALEGIITRFPYLRYGLAIILVFIGCKMLLVDIYKIPVFVSLGFIVLVITLSMLWKKSSLKINKDAYTRGD